MDTAQKLTVAVVGLGFGKEFLPIYMQHPDVRAVVIADRDRERVDRVGATYGIDYRYQTLEEVLDDAAVDAVHLATPVALHARQSVAVLDSGRHCACSVPMGTTLPELEAVVAAQTRSAKNYMMMETAVYGRDYLAVREIYRSGRFGEATFFRGFHIQNLDGFPRYWLGYPPMLYATHALSPVLDLLGTGAESVECRGSGRLTPERRGDYVNEFPVEVALFELQGADLIAEVTVSFFQVARSYMEGFSLYGENMSAEWPEREGGQMRVFELSDDIVRDAGGGASSIHRVIKESLLPPYDGAIGLPASVASFTKDTTWVSPATGAKVEVLSHHGGSHPRLVHEFLRSIVEDRPPAIDVRLGARWTAAGIAAHLSAMESGKKVPVPHF